MQESQNTVSLKYLFITFFRIGCVSFGGHMALVSLLQSIMVNRDKKIGNDDVLNSLAIASFMPGPLAVNVVANIGYKLKGKLGAAISMFAVLLPACLLMLGLAYVYYSTTLKVDWKLMMQYVGGIVGVVILSTGLQLFKKEIAFIYYKIIIFIIALTVDFMAGCYLVAVLLMIFGAVLSTIFNPDKNNKPPSINKFSFKPKFFSLSAIAVGVIVINQVLFLTGWFKTFPHVLLKITTVFSGISISLFGGGLVVIPMMQSILVRDLKWLTPNELIDVIAFSQVTPGPILVSSTFIGFKLGGLFGALLATCAMFIPSAILMIIVSKFFNKTKDHPLIKNILSGIKAVVIGLIISSALKILYLQPRTILVSVICLISFILIYKFKISPIYLILAAIFIGTITNFI